MAISTRLRAPSLAIRLAMWVLTVLSVMCSSLGDLAVGPPAATAARICSSRSVSGSMGCAGGAAGPASAKAASSRAVTLGAMSASPLAAAWTAWASRSGPASLSRKPRAPARSAA